MHFNLRTCAERTSGCHLVSIVVLWTPRIQPRQHGRETTNADGLRTNANICSALVIRSIRVCGYHMLL